MDYDILNKFHDDIQKYIKENPKEQKYLSYIFNNQNLFNDLSDSYYSDEDNDTNDYIVELFNKAKQEDELRYSEINDKINFLETENTEYKEKVNALSHSLAESAAAKAAEDYLVIVSDEKKTEVTSSKSKTVYITFKILIGALLFSFFGGSLLIIIPNIDFDIGFNTDLTLTLRNLSYFLIPIYILVFSIYLYRNENIDILIDRIHGISEKSVLKIIGKVIMQSLSWIFVVIILSITIGIVGDIIYCSMSK